MGKEHTPRPWTYSGDEDGDFVVWGPGNNEFLANVDQESFGPVPPMKVAFDINQANARLISAAPELLEALQDVKRDIARAATNNVIWPATVRKIEAAIAKAQGSDV